MWDFTDGFQRTLYPLVAAWVGHYPKQAMVAQVSYSSCQMCEIPNSVQMGHSTFRPLDNSRDHQIYTELLEGNNIDALHTLGVHPIRNQFWQDSPCNGYCLWPDELHQLLLGLLKDILHWLFKYLKARNVKDQFDKWFTLVPWCAGIWHFSEPFNSLKSSTWQGKEIRGMIRTLPVNSAPILDFSKDDGNTAVENATDEVVMRPVWEFFEFSWPVRQQNHSDVFLNALYDALKWLYLKQNIVWKQKMAKCVMAKVDDLFATESHQLSEHKIHKICGAMEALVYGAEKVSTTKCRQFQMHLTKPQQVASAWSDTDCQKPIER